MTNHSKILNAINSATKYHFEPSHWTYSNNNGTEKVEFVFRHPSEARFIYSSHKSFLGFKWGHETFSIDSETIDSYEDWIELSSACDAANRRFGVY